jgi:hypothetical protein
MSTFWSLFPAKLPSAMRRWPEYNHGTRLALKSLASTYLSRKNVTMPFVNVFPYDQKNELTHIHYR